MAKWSQQATQDLSKFSTPQSGKNEYFISKTDLENTRSTITRLANGNAGEGKANKELKTEKNYTTFSVELKGEEILSIKCTHKSSVRLTAEKAWK